MMRHGHFSLFWKSISETQRIAHKANMIKSEQILRGAANGRWIFTTVILVLLTNYCSQPLCIVTSYA